MRKQITDIYKQSAECFAVDRVYIAQHVTEKVAISVPTATQAGYQNLNDLSKKLK